MLKAFNTHVGGHIGDNLWLWTAISLAIMFAAIFVMGRVGKGYYMGEILTVAACFAGTCMILISQRNSPHPEIIDDEDEVA
jgi:hypothetical protein